jgi:kinesin family protein 15
MELVESQRGGASQQTRHIPYRDSRLTFLLQDSLGGNAKSLIIANVSSSSLCAAETSSTLQFVSRAKCIKNKASINLLYRGDVALLQKEIIRLNTELDALRRGPGSQNEALAAAMTENKELRVRVEKMARCLEEDELRIGGLAAENARLKRDKLKIESRLEEVMEGKEKDNLTWKLEAEEAQGEVKRHEARILKLEGEVEDALHHARAAEQERDHQSDDLTAQIRSLEDRLAGEAARADAIKEAMSLQSLKMSEDAREAVANERTRGEVILSSFKAEVEEQLLEMEGLRSEEVSALEDELMKLRGAHAQEKACLMHDKVEMEGEMRSELEALRVKLEQVERQRADLKFESEGRIEALESEVKSAHDQRQQQVADLQEKIKGMEAEAQAAAEAKEARVRAEEIKERSASEREERLKQQLAEAEVVSQAAQKQIMSLSSLLSQAKAEISEKEGAIQSLQNERLSHRNTNLKQAKAFTEIMRLIEWATTPPGSSEGSPEPEATGGTSSAATASGAKKLRESLVGLLQHHHTPSSESSAGPIARDGIFLKSRLSLLARGEGDLTGEEDDLVSSPMVKNRRDQ